MSRGPFGPAAALTAAALRAAALTAAALRAAALTAAALTTVSCSAPLDRGTHAPDPTWTSGHLRPDVATTGGALAVGEIGVIEGDADTVSGIDGAWGLRVDDERNDLAAVVGRFAREVADVPAVLVLLTGFDDRGAGGAGYFVPISNNTPGTGMGPIDARGAYGAQHLEAVANLKSAPTVALAVHELAHRHAAYLEVATATTILGRQRSHWHAALHSEASLLDGYAWRDLGGGRFEVLERGERLGSLDLYALGWLPAEEVPPFFFIDDARTEGGARIPPAAQLAIGTIVRGRRVDLTIADVVARLGPRPPAPPELRVVFGLVTAPGVTAAEASSEVARADALRLELEAAWPEWTRPGVSLCTRLAGCANEPSPSPSPTVQPDPGGGCDCATTSSPDGPAAALAIAIALAAIARRQRNSSSAALSLGRSRLPF